MKNKPVNTYLSYIATTPAKLWDALTNPDLTKEYFFGRRIDSDWTVGSPVKYWLPDGTLDVSGKVLEYDPPRRLSYSWRAEANEELRKLPEAIITFTADPLGDVVRLTMEEFHPSPIDPKHLDAGRRSWPVVFSSLKSLIETGRSLPPFDMTK